VHFEIHPSSRPAITREKQIKNFSREEKINLIRNVNPDFKDIYPEILGKGLKE